MAVNGKQVLMRDLLAIASRKLVTDAERRSLAEFLSGLSPEDHQFFLQFHLSEENAEARQATLAEFAKIPAEERLAFLRSACREGPANFVPLEQLQEWLGGGADELAREVSTIVDEAKAKFTGNLRGWARRALGLGTAAK